MLGVEAAGDFEVGHGGDALAEPLVLGFGVPVAGLELEDALDGCDAADGEPAVAGEGVGVASAECVNVVLPTGIMGGLVDKTNLGAAAQS